MTRYSILAEDYIAADVGEYLPRYDTGMVRRGEEWGTGWVPVELPKLLSGGDYDGGSNTVSNHRVFTQRYADVPGVWQFSSGYGGYGVLLTPWALAWVIEGDPSDTGPGYAGAVRTIRDVLDELDDYCILDEDDEFEVEQDAEDAAWDNWARGDYQHTLAKRYPWLEDTYFAEERAAGITDSSRPDNETRALPFLRDVFDRAMDRANVYWENETGNTAYVDVNRVAAATTASDLAEFGILPSNAGSVSHGTMRPADLIPAFLGALESVIPADDDDGKEGFTQLQASYTRLQATIGWDDSEDAHWLTNELFKALDARAPAGYYFGAHPGDGADYGCWPAED